ncbi:MAG: TetR/AcrR family transcriptional regulator [Solirubrobacterales bacterium]
MVADPTDTPVESVHDYPPELSRLPPGRHGLPREFVIHNQRERLIAGLAEAVAENGYAKTTIAHITRHAAVSRRTFYEHFSSKDECFVAAYDTVMAELRECVGAAFEEQDEWPQAVKAGIGAMLGFLAAEPNLARLCMVEALVAGPVVVERYDAAIQSLVPYFQAGREGRSPDVLSRLSPTTEEALVGGMVSLISRRIFAGRTAELESLLPDLVEFTLTPYLGSAEAAKVARES